MAPRVETYTHATDINDAVIAAFESNEGAANIMYPFILKAKDLPRDGAQLWIAYFEDDEQVPFVLSCTKGVLGNYPVFIFTTKPPTERKPCHYHAAPRASCAYPSRIRGPGEGFRCVLLRGHHSRVRQDLGRSYPHCYWERILQGHILLLHGGHVHAVFGPASPPRGSRPYNLAGPRERISYRLRSLNSARTSVFTNPRWRELGCAERLLRRVCRDLLVEKDRIVLYVGVENSAARLYQRVGFQGLVGGDEVEGQRVELGFW
ncbi:hypothetical protein BKA83DRAFT_4200879 [Pisolithus microcarpus]|nr:hypothetical protein BKA83DRAFT_4200879 [Pisolithus microcarpus]